MSADVAAALRELKRRARARESLHTYALSVDIPTVPFDAPCPDEDLLGPARYAMAPHHAMILDVLQRTMTRHMGRCMIFAPPGSAKSLYTSVLAPTWYMGRKPGSRIILGSFNHTVAERQSRRAMQICAQQKYRDIWPEAPTLEREAASDWTLSNKSNMLALGMTGGVTSNRADGLIFDDPIAGREDADSEQMRQKTLDAYKDDWMTRLLPGAWIAFIMTRWHEADLAGSILPDDYDGRSGMVRCKDGLDWEILNIQAKCERADDPLGRQPGEYLWPEFYSEAHWKMFEDATGPEAARTWSSLYQQRPAPQGSGRFDEKMFDFYKPGSQPPLLAYVGAGDYAVTEGKNDFTELGVFGVDPEGGLWEVDWAHGQWNTGDSTEKTIDLMKKWKLPMFFNEGGVIDKAMGPLINLRMRQRRVYCDRRAMPSMQDKVAKCSSFQGRAATGMVHFRDNANSRRVVGQLVALPAGRHDDAADVCGLIGRAIDVHIIPRTKTEKKRNDLKPFSVQWLEWQEKPEAAIRYR
jgi:phage terminase large subunit-like protein